MDPQKRSPKSPLFLTVVWVGFGSVSILLNTIADFLPSPYRYEAMGFGILICLVCIGATLLYNKFCRGRQFPGR